MTNVRYKSAPLPFQGQKRGFVKEVAKVFEEVRESRKINTVVDLFGGSGLLSRLAKDVIGCGVVYNDYDGYAGRLDKIGQTNEILRDLRAICLDSSVKDRRFSGDIRSLIIDRLAKEADADWMTISSWLLFSGHYAKDFDSLSKENFYYGVKKTDYNEDEAKTYLDGLTMDSRHWEDVFADYQNRSDVLFIFDPPYMTTDIKSYNKSEFWNTAAHLNILASCRELPNFIFFTSDKSNMVELCDWLDTHGYDSPMTGTSRMVKGVTLNATSTYQDCFLYKIAK